MRAFALLVDRLSQAAKVDAQSVLLGDYLASTPDPDRGYALALLFDDLSFPKLKSAALRNLAQRRIDPILFALSLDFVGDRSETLALTWPDRPGLNRRLDLSDIVESLAHVSDDSVEDLLDRLDADGRWAMLRLATGGLRLKLSPTVATSALQRLAQSRAQMASVGDIEEVWRSHSPPYAQLFLWLEGLTPTPRASAPGWFRPMMLAQSIDGAADIAGYRPSEYAAERMWNGVRVQLVREAGVTKLYNRMGEDISSAFPEILAGMTFEGVIDGQLVIWRGSTTGSWSDLQQRLGRKSPTARLLQSHPIAILAFDLLNDAGEDVRCESFRQRRARLEALMVGLDRGRLLLSPLIAFDQPEDLATLRAETLIPGARGGAGIVLKRWDSPYMAGRGRAAWLKWRRDPFRVQAALLYVQRGDGGRPGGPLELTFGVWRDGQMVPIGKVAYEGPGDGLKAIESFVRANTVEKFGPVRRVIAEPDRGVVLEIAFADVLPSSRHKSGLILHQPRLLGILTDRTPKDAAQIGALERFLTPEPDTLDPDINSGVG